MRYLSIRNLEKYQHYKERRPVWVKLYQSLLEDIAFTCLQDASKAHAILLILIASRYDNRIPWDAKWIGRAIHASEPVDLDAMIASGYLVDADELPAVVTRERRASKPLATREQVATPKRTENREQTTASAAAARANDALLDRLTGTLPGPDLDAVRDFLDGTSSPSRWAAEFGAMLDGMAGHEAATPTELALACRHFLLNGERPTARLFNGYVRSARQGHAPMPNGRSRPGVAERTYQNAIRATEGLT